MARKKKKTNAEILSDVTEKLVQKISDGGLLPWQSGITQRYTGDNRPHNPWSKSETTRKSYAMGNALFLQLMGMLNGFSDPRWAGYGHIQDAGGQVRKGEKSTQVIQAKPVFERGEDGKPVRDEHGQKIVRFYGYRLLNVFNVEQADWPEGTLPALATDQDDRPEVERSAEADAIREAYCRKARVGYVEKDFGPNESPCYMGFSSGTREDRGRVVMPKPDACHDERLKVTANWVSTLFHELGHSTGHDDLLNRGLKGYSTTNKIDYSKEELVAELVGAICAAHVGFTPDYDNSAAYLEGWLEAFKGSPQLLHESLKLADKAIRMILDHEGL